MCSFTSVSRKIRYGHGSLSRCQHSPIDLTSNTSNDVTKTDSDYCRFLPLFNHGLFSDDEEIAVVPLVVKTPSGRTRTVLGMDKKEEEAEVSSPPLATTRSRCVYQNLSVGKGRVASK